MLSLRASTQDFRGNPPDEWNQVTITTKIAVFSRPVGKLSIHFPSNRGIVTEAVALARNDSLSLQTPICHSLFGAGDSNSPRFLLFPHIL